MIPLTGTIDGQAFELLMPDGYAAAAQIPLVVYCHGSGEDETAMRTDPLKAPTAAAIVAAGFAIASSNAHGASWGNDASQNDYVAVVDRVRAIASVGPIVLIGQSMGGIASLNLILRRRISGVVGWLGIYPASSLRAAFDHPSLGPQVRAAYGITIDSQYDAATAGHDPLLLPPALYSGLRMAAWHSPADTLVTKAQNTDPLQQAAAPFATEFLVHRTAGEHGDATNFEQPARGEQLAFLQRCITPAPDPDPPTVSRLNAGELTWSLHTLRDGARIGILEEVLPGSFIDGELQGRRTAQVTLSTDDPMSAEIYPLGVVLRGWLDGWPMFAGPLLQPTFDDEAGTIEAPAIGPRYRLESFQVAMRGDGEPFPGHAPSDPFRWEGVPQGEIMRRLVEYADPTPAEQSAGIPTHGIVAGQIVDGPARDREYDPGKQIAEALDELGNVIDGPDWDLVPVWDPARPATLARLDVLTVAGGDLTRTVVLERGVGRDNCAGFRWMPGGDTGGPIVNRYQGVGEAPTYDGEASTAPEPPSFRGNQFDSQVAFGLYTRYEGLSGVKDEDTVAGQVAGVLATGAFPVDHFEVVPRPDAIAFSPVGQLWLGDWFSARCSSGYVDLDLQGRAVGFRVEVVDETGATKTSIRAAPRENRAVTA